MRDHQYFVYVLTNASRHPLYVGVARSLARRLQQHRDETEGYCARYHLTRLVYFETFKMILNAIDREKQLKRWSRKKKVWLIESVNPKWDDLSRQWGKAIGSKAMTQSCKEPRSLDSASLRSG